MDLDPDPWNWTVDDVVHFFKDRAADYIADLPHPRLPPKEPFLAALKENDIDGAALLESVNTATLKSDLDIPSLGVRNSVFRCINKLKSQSLKYTADQSSQALHYSALQLPTPTAAPPQPVAPASPPVDSPIENATERTRQSEVQFLDASGKKRRKVNPTQITQMPMEHINPNFALPSSQNGKATHGGYFGDSACPVDELFYGKTTFGQEISELHADGEILVEPQDLRNDLADQNFHFYNQQKRIGEAGYVYKQMRYFLGIDPIEYLESDTDGSEPRRLERNSKSALAFVPYKESLQSSRSATVLQFKPGQAEPVPIKESLEHLTSGHTPDEYMQQTAGEWDFLVQKHKTTEDEVLPAYGDSDDEDGEETAEPTEGDLGQDAAEEEAEDLEDRAPSKEQVAEIIEAYKIDYIAKWHEGLEKLEEKKAWSVWKQMRRSRTWRETLIQSARSDIGRLNTRLHKMQEWIISAEHRTETSVQESCASLDVTLADREEQKWKIEVWNRKKEPYHVVRHGTKAAHTGLATRLTTSKAERPPQMHPDDRLSVSPGPVDHMDTDVGTTEDEIQYEADVETDLEQHQGEDGEEFHTPDDTSALDDTDAGFVTSADEMQLDLEQPSQAGPLTNDNGLTGLDRATDTETVLNEPPAGDDDKNSTFSPKEESSESEGLVSPSTFLSQKHKTAQTPQPQRPCGSGLVDLIGTTSESSTAKKKKTKSSARANPFLGDPLQATAEEVDGWVMSELKNRDDRQRVLIKLLRNVGADNRQRLHECYTALHPHFSNHLLPACQFAKESGQAGIGFIDTDVEPISLAGSICVSWLFSTRTADEIRNMSDGEFEGTLDNNQLGYFTKIFRMYLLKRDTSLFQTPQRTPSKPKFSDPKSTPSKIMSSEVIVISSDDQGPSQLRSPNIRRKRAVRINEEAVNSRAKAHLREKKFAESLYANSSQLAAMVADGSSSSTIEINPARDKRFDPIYIHDKIARKMKPHQIDGVQFLWREITADDEDEGAQGCVLAHTMGLGKTMQTIALLMAVNKAARSKEKNVRRQLPSNLRPKGIKKRMLRILVLCPPSLLDNWGREIEEWAPGRLGHVYSIDSSNKNTRMNKLEDWVEFGGVALLGYEKFAGMILQKQRANAKNPMPDEDQAELREMLLKGPELVVADEAHRLKDRATDNSKAAAQIETHSRIALTGTPMSNNVEEIYSLISWAAPGYLGDPVEFKAHYAEPIAAGTGADSTAYERRKSIMKLKVLHTEIQPKVNRANIEVLKGSLKPKVEFVITVPLQEAQAELYKRYVDALLSGGLSSNASQVKLFAWLSVLQLLTNHPHCFREKLLEPPKPKKAKRKGQDNELEVEASRDQTPMTAESGSATPISENMAEGGEEALDDQTPEQLGLNQGLIRNILAGFEEDLDHQLSAKMAIFVPLLRLCLECRDKVLLFSSSIPTLDYLAELLTNQKLKFGRIDGSKSMKQKMQAIEDFNSHEFDVMLVSTRAGGVGLNIQGANRVFIFDLSFNPAHEEQAIGRAYRIGQTKHVYVYRFVAGGTFETNIDNKQLFKSSLAMRVVDKKNPTRLASRNVRDWLYEPKPVRQANLIEEMGKDPNVLDKLLSQHGPGEPGKFDTLIRGIKTMETLQEEEVDEPLNEDEQREVNMEIEQSRMRPKGKKPLGVAPHPLQSTAPVPGAGLIKLPISVLNSTQPAPRADPGAPAFMPPPNSIFAGPSGQPPRAPPSASESMAHSTSTFAGPSGQARPQFQHPLGGLPSPRTPGS